MASNAESPLLHVRVEERVRVRRPRQESSDASQAGPPHPDPLLDADMEERE
jgi:hypothetical protein